jgi:hypothetical protein
MFGAGPRPAPVPGLGLNAGNYLRLRPCPVWKGGPDASGNVPVGVPGTESYRQYLHRINRWVLTGQRVGVPNGMMASEISEALPDGARKATDSIPAEALLDDGWLPGTQGPGDLGNWGGLQEVIGRLNRKFLDQQGDHAIRCENTFEATKRSPGETMDSYRTGFTTAYDDAVRESGNQ